MITNILIGKHKPIAILFTYITLFHDTKLIKYTDRNKKNVDQIPVLHFKATDDPRILGVEPIPNIGDKIAAIIERYRAETIDIEMSSLRK